MSYPGGKGASGVAQAIINQQPPHSWYIEPFIGGGSVFLAKRPAARNTIIDLDQDAIRRLIASPLPATVDVLWTESIEWLKENGAAFDERTLIYCDPPYPFAARLRARRLYRCEMSDAAHVALLTVLQGLRCMIQVSSYWNPLYAEMLEGWRLVKFPAMTRGGLAEECLWMNYAEPKALHDYRYLGGDFRERERIKRKTLRWRSRIAKLPQLERLVLHSAISAAIAGDNDFGRRASLELTTPDLASGPAASLQMAAYDRTGVTA